MKRRHSVPMALTVLSLILFSGCSSQAKKTHEVFERGDASYEELNQALERLRPIGDNGATHEKFRALKALRHLAKYMTDPGEREMAVRELVFLSAFGDDNDVVESCESRLMSILSDKNEDLSLKLAVITAKKEVVTAELRYNVTHTSLFSKEVEEEIILPETGVREEALEFLIDQFEDLPEILQYRAVALFGSILVNPVVCYEKGEGESACDEDDSKERGEWIENLWEQVGDWLEGSNLSPLIRSSLVLMAARIPGIKNEESQETWLEYWQNNDKIPEETKLLITAAVNRSKGEYPELVASSTENGTEEGDAADVKTYRRDATFGQPGSVERSAFWLNNATLIVDRQLFRTDDQEEIKEKRVPAEWLFYSGYNDSDESKVSREIIYNASVEALKSGHLITDYDALVPSLGQIVETANDLPPWFMEKALSIVSLSYGSLHARGDKIEPLLEVLENGVRNAPNLYLKRQFFYSLIAGLPFYQELIEPNLCLSLREADVLTRHLLNERVRAIASENLTSFCGAELQQSTESESGSEVIAPSQERETPNGSDTAVETPSGSDTAAETPGDPDTAVETPSNPDTAVETPSNPDTAVETPSDQDTATEDSDSVDAGTEGTASDGGSETQ